NSLPNGPFQISKYTSYHVAYTGDPVHRFFQMWQQFDQGKLDLFVWVGYRWESAPTILRPLPRRATLCRAARRWASTTLVRATPRSSTLLLITTRLATTTIRESWAGPEPIDFIQAAVEHPLQVIVQMLSELIQLHGRSLPGA